MERKFGDGEVVVGSEYQEGGSALLAGRSLYDDCLSRLTPKQFRALKSYCQAVAYLTCLGPAL